MFKSVLAFAVAGSALAIAAPASAQYYPQSPYGYSNGYGYGNGYGYNSYQSARELQRRVWNVKRSLGNLRPDQAYRLNIQANNLQRRIQYAARGGLNPYEVRSLDAQVNQLERQVNWAARHSYGYNGYNGNGYNGYDRHDWREQGDRNDRWENDNDDQDGD